MVPKKAINYEKITGLDPGQFLFIRTLDFFHQPEHIFKNFSVPSQEYKLWTFYSLAVTGFVRIDKVWSKNRKQKKNKRLKVSTTDIARSQLGTLYYFKFTLFNNIIIIIYYYLYYQRHFVTLRGVLCIKISNEAHCIYVSHFDFKFKLNILHDRKGTYYKSKLTLRINNVCTYKGPYI